MQDTKRFAGARSLTRSDSSCGAAVVAAAAVVVVAHVGEGGRGEVSYFNNLCSVAGVGEL